MCVCVCVFPVTLHMSTVQTYTSNASNFTPIHQPHAKHQSSNSLYAIHKKPNPWTRGVARFLGKAWHIYCMSDVPSDV